MRNGKGGMGGNRRFGAVIVFGRAAVVGGLLLAGAASADAAAIDEVNHWRSQNGLPTLEEDAELTRFAQAKAEWRAARLAKNGHQGPPVPAGCREGCGEATASWGWLTCCQEETGTRAGAGVAIGADGERYMVLVMRGTNGSAPRGRKIGGGGSLRIVRTAHLTPDAPVMPRAGG